MWSIRISTHEEAGKGVLSSVRTASIPRPNCIFLQFYYSVCLSNSPQCSKHYSNFLALLYNCRRDSPLDITSLPSLPNTFFTISSEPQGRVILFPSRNAICLILSSFLPAGNSFISGVRWWVNLLHSKVHLSYVWKHFLPQRTPTASPLQIQKRQRSLG